MKKKVAIIGTGIAGMSAAYKLQRDFDITVYEKNNYVGGHTNTVLVDEDGNSIPVDTGFMVYNEVTYPNLKALFQELDVKTKPTSMTFSVQHLGSGLEFSGTGISGLFAQRKNLFRISHFRFLAEINRFNKTCGEVLEDRNLQALTLREYCQKRGYTEDFQQKYLVPMSAAVWSSPPGKMLEFPALTLVRFFTNHRFLGLSGQLQWRTVDGGSRMYRDKLISSFRSRIQVNCGAVRVKQFEGGAQVTDKFGKTETFDVVVIAAHADEALTLIENPTELQRQTLEKFKYQKNVATLHTDESVMPKTRSAWSSWNYRVDQEGPSTIYWMNSLQGVSKKKNYFVSINDPGKIKSEYVIQRIDYDHPLYDLQTIEAQTRLPKLNQAGPIFLCGSYFNYGFHEDALTSGLNAAESVASYFRNWRASL